MYTILYYSTITRYIYYHHKYFLKKTVSLLYTRMGTTIKKAQKLNLGRSQSLDQKNSPTVFKKSIFRMLGESKQNINKTSFSNTLGIPYKLKQLPTEM